MTAKRSSPAAKAKKGAGRPRLEFDLQQVEQLAAIQCTDGELAAVLGCSRQTILNRKDDDADFLAAIEKGRESGKASLRRLQWKAANAGNTGMLVWLGKQYLRQTDRHDQVSSNVNVNLAGLTDDQLERLAGGDDLRDVLAERGE